MGRSFIAFPSPCSPGATPGSGFRMECFQKRLCSGPQRLPFRYEPCHSCSKEPSPGLGLGPLEIQETALGGLVCWSTLTTRTALGTSGRGGRLGEGRGSEESTRGGIEEEDTCLKVWGRFQTFPDSSSSSLETEDFQTLGNNCPFIEYCLALPKQQ